MLTIEELKKELSKRETRFNEESTTGNFDDTGNLILESVPTLTTEYCEIGFYKDSVYFVFIAESCTWSYDFYTAIKNVPTLQLYGLKNCTKNYELGETIERDIKSDTHFQIQVTLDANTISNTELFETYDKITNLLIKYSVHAVNQLDAPIKC